MKTFLTWAKTDILLNYLLPIICQSKFNVAVNVKQFSHFIKITHTLWNVNYTSFVHNLYYICLHLPSLFILLIFFSCFMATSTPCHAKSKFLKFEMEKRCSMLIHSLINLQDWKLTLVDKNQRHYDFDWLKTFSIFACIL